ncbi:MAG: TIGR02647 family protein, partial [Vibrio sp.]
MKFTPEHLAQLNLLLQFDPSSTQTGIKVHQDAAPELKQAAQDLFDLNLCTLPDGGYLTDEGLVLSEHALKLLHVLESK